MPPSPRKSFRSFTIPLFSRAREVVDSFSASGRVLFYILAGLIIISAIGLLYLLNARSLVEVPAHGGSYTEGIIGSPRFINPVLALSDADRDLTALVYSGLLRPSQNGDFIPDLAQDYSISPDGKTYIVHIRANAKFQDGTPVTADDVIFTINKALDPAIKSPLLANWEGVSATALDAHTVEFDLAKPYTPFIDNLTMGILPKHLWQDVSADEFPFSELNTNPVGSGPYRVSGVARTSSGIPSSYDLQAFHDYTLGEPYISNMTMKFYQNEDALIAALKSGSVEAASGISPAQLAGLKGYDIMSIPLNRVFGVFFNQNQNAVLRDPTVRAALSAAVDRTALVQSVLAGYGTAIEGPIPPSLGGDIAPATTGTGDLALAAQATLLKAGWVLGPNGILQKTTGTKKAAQTVPLAFTLATGNVPELVAAANSLKETWGRMGAQVTVQVYDQGDLSENVIRPRKYDALLFGEIIGRGLDLFAFWDSSQRNDPGLNIALYTNSAVDSLLEQLRTVSQDAARQTLYQKIESQIESDMPAVFLYTPDFVYVVPKNVRNMSFGVIENPSDRFDSVADWYRQTDHVWPVFVHK